MFDDHLMIDQEIVLLSTVDTAELKESSLLLRYRDPRFDGRLLRELEGDKSLLKRLQGELRRACERLSV